MADLVRLQVREDSDDHDWSDTGHKDGDLPLPISSAKYAIKVTEAGDVTYIAKAPVGTAQATAGWQVMKVDEAVGAVITWADGDIRFDNVATDLTALVYS